MTDTLGRRFLFDRAASSLLPRRGPPPIQDTGDDDVILNAKHFSALPTEAGGTAGENARAQEFL